MKKFFMVILVILFSLSMYGQIDCNPTVNGQFVGQELNLQTMTYYVKVQMNITDNNNQALEMEYCNVRFTFNIDGLEFVSGNVLTFTEANNYTENSVELSSDGKKIKVEFELNNCATGVNVGEDYVDIAELTFNVLDVEEFSNICLFSPHIFRTTQTNGDLPIGVWLCDENPLPVELTQFTVQNVNNVVTLNWTTATELNNQGFDIERNYDNGYWYKVGFVPGSGNSYIPIHYSFIDNPTLSGTYQYRLKQIDLNGTVEYSEIVETNIVLDKYSLGQNYPNPFNPSTTIRYEMKDAGNVQLRVYDTLGNEVSVLVNSYQDVGIHYVTLDASNLASGLYIAQLIASTFNVVH